MGLRLFNFWWDGIGYGGSDWFGDLRTAHEAFNAGFSVAFPRQMYTSPFTSYTSGLGIINGSRLSGLGETNYNDAGIRAWVLSAAEQAGITGDPSQLHVSSEPIGYSDGTSMQIPGSTVNPLATTDGVNAAIGVLSETSWYLYAAGAVVLAVLLTRR